VPLTPSTFLPGLGQDPTRTYFRTLSTKIFCLKTDTDQMFVPFPRYRVANMINQAFASRYAVLSIVLGCASFYIAYFCFGMGVSRLPLAVSSRSTHTTHARRLTKESPIMSAKVIFSSGNTCLPLLHLLIDYPIASPSLPDYHVSNTPAYY
jgi:hypothetical protein